MIIVNADDWGRSPAQTDTSLACFAAGRITSVSAMMFMSDSARAADLAKNAHMDVGLHLNFSLPFTGSCQNETLRKYHDRVIQFTTRSKYARVLYNPGLRKEFHYLYRAQVEEYCRLYGRSPSHINGHWHLHLCMNMLLDRIIPRQEKVRRSWHFLPGERNVMNRTYRRLIDLVLERRYRTTRYFFSLAHCLEENRMTLVAELAADETVELMTHPAKEAEYAHLMGEDYLQWLSRLKLGNFSSL